MNNEPIILSAAVVLPIAGPPITEGAIVIGGERIVAVGSAAELRRQFAGAREVSFAQSALLPGFINAHTHMELSFLRRKFCPSHFVEWVVQVIRAVPQEDEALAVLIPPAVHQGMGESLAFGVTTVGDITRQVHLSRGVLRDGPIRVVSFGEVQALGGRRGMLAERLGRAADSAQRSATLRIGISPHAPYTVEGPALQATVQAALQTDLPLCMHLAELQEEREFLASLGGGIRGIWDAISMTGILLDDRIPKYDGGPIRWARHWGLLATGAGRHGPLLAHVNYADETELDILAASGASVAYCPRTRQFFGHDQITPHRWRDMLARGMNVCLATDSLASNPDLSVLREAQTVLSLFPDAAPETLLQLITRNAARALGMEDQIGTLEAGKWADLIALPLATAREATPAEIARALITAAPSPQALWIGGRRLL